MLAVNGPLSIGCANSRIVYRRDTMPQCSLCPNELGDSPHNVNGKPVCASCHERIQDYADRVQARYERLQKRAEREAEAGRADVTRAHDMASLIPFGQPILVGHHSEGRDRRYRERIHDTFARGYARLERADRMRQRAESAANNRAISSDDPAAILKLEVKIAEAERNHELMKAANAVIRQALKLQRTFAEQVIFAAEKLNISVRDAEALMRPDFMGRVGVPAYELSNNNANIRRMKQRLEDLKRQAAKAAEQAAQPDQGNEVVAGVEIERDAVENRLRLHFPGKPDSATIADLKARGFRWSPSNMAWQRQLNNGAEWAAQCVLEAYAKRSA
jgi:hypothetical protein